MRYRGLADDNRQPSFLRHFRALPEPSASLSLHRDDSAGRATVQNCGVL